MGKTLEWKKIMSMEIEELDIQHKEIINIINSIYSLKNNQHPENLKNVFNKLINYIKYHFETEERYLKMFNCPDTENHLAEHRYILNQLDLYNNNDFDVNNTIKVLGFLSGWFYTHIMFVDKHYVAIFNENLSNNKKSIHPH